MLVSVHGFFAFAETDDSTRSAYPASRSDFSLHMTIFGRPDTISYVTMGIPSRSTHEGVFGGLIEYRRSCYG